MTSHTKRARRKQGPRRARVLSHLRGSANIKMSTDEILALTRKEPT